MLERLKVKSKMKILKNRTIWIVEHLFMASVQTSKFVGCLNETGHIISKRLLMENLGRD